MSANDLFHIKSKSVTTTLSVESLRFSQIYFLAICLFYFDKSSPKQDSLFQTVAVDRLKSWISHPKNGLHFNGRINAESRKESPL